MSFVGLFKMLCKRGKKVLFMCVLMVILPCEVRFLLAKWWAHVLEISSEPLNAIGIAVRTSGC